MHATAAGVSMSSSMRSMKRARLASSTPHSDASSAFTELRRGFSSNLLARLSSLDSAASASETVVGVTSIGDR